MLLVLSDCIAGIDFHAEDELCHAINHVLTSDSEGKHIVIAGRAVIDCLLNVSGLLNRSAVGVLRRLHSQYAQKRSISSLVKTQVVIVAEDGDVITGDDRYKVPLRYFIDRSLSDSTVLLCENLTDCNAYRYSAKHYMIRNKIRGLKISAKDRLGGGSTMGKVLENIRLTKDEMCLCLVDSDKYSPSSAIGDTAKECVKQCDGSWVLKVLLTNERELENAVPLGCVLESLDGDALGKALKLEELADGDGCDLLKYIDLKKGTNLGWVYNNTMPNSDQRKYWQDEIQKISVEMAEKSKECIESDKCNDEENCQCVLFEGLGDKLLSSVVCWLNHVSAHKSCEAIVGHECSTWDDVGQEVFEWCCAADKLRI